MRVGIDCRFAASPHGLGRYTRSLIPEVLRQAPADFEFVLFVQSVNDPWLETIKTNNQSFDGAQDRQLITSNSPHYSLTEQLQFPSLIKKSGIDLFYSPHFNVPLRCPVPFIATIHDLILHRYPNHAPHLKRIAYRKLMKYAVKKSEALIVVSDFTSREVSSVYGETAQEKMHVIGEGVASVFQPASESDIRAVREKYQLERDFYLYVGSAKEHKNVQMLIDVFEASHLAEAHDLVLATGGKEATSLKIRSPAIKRFADVSDSDLPALYTAVRCFVTASLYEGYCLPIVEARACGCPVIATDATAIPEVCDETCALVSPNDPNALSRAMQSPPKRSASGHTVLPQWEESAHGVLKLLANLI